MAIRFECAYVEEEIGGFLKIDAPIGLIRNFQFQRSNEVFDI